MPRGPVGHRSRDPRMSLALVSPTHLALQHFQGGHSPPTLPHMETDVARPARELARATGLQELSCLSPSIVGLGHVLGDP